MPFKVSDIKKMPCAHLNQEVIRELEQVKKSAPAKEPVGLQFIKHVLETQNIPYVTELPFAPGRKFRFDIALQPLKVAIEYEGIFNGKSRHTTVGGYSKDAEKYNLAASLGWKVYRYTAMNYKEFANDLKNICLTYPSKKSSSP